MKTLIPAEPNIQSSLAMLTEIYSAANQAREPKQEQNSVPLSRYLFILRRNRWRILAIVMASLLGDLRCLAASYPNVRVGYGHRR